MGLRGGRRRPRRREKVPALAEAAAVAGAGCAAGCAVAPALALVDRAVVEAAAGARGGVLGNLRRLGLEFLRRPGRALRGPAVWMVAGVYSATYVAANLLELRGRRLRLHPAEAKGQKFVGTTATNMAASVLKDAAFAQMFGASPTKAAVPAVSYALFALRDGLTVASGFLLPGALGSAAASLTGREEAQCTQAAQLVTPSLLQLVCTPVHLLALDFVNHPPPPRGSGLPGVSLAARLQANASSSLARTAFLARALRMLPAYGIGGLLNNYLVRAGSEALERGYESDGADRRAQATPPALSWNAAHPGRLALEARRSWERLVQSSTAPITQGTIDRFVERADLNGDGVLSVAEVERCLEEEHHTWTRRHRRELARAMVAAADADGSGTISRDELEAVLRTNVVVKFW